MMQVGSLICDSIIIQNVKTVIYSDQSVAIIENTNTEDMRKFVLPYASTKKTETDANIPINATSRFSLNQELVEEIDFSERIIPMPFKVTVKNDAQTFDIKGASMVNGGLLGNLWTGATDLLQKLGLNGMNNYKVTFVLGSLSSEIAGSESYTMEITKEGTTITGSDAQGLFHGLMSFIGLLHIRNNGQMTLKEMTIDDKPRFGYRGHQVDVARNFRSKEAIMKTIDAMALWKVRTRYQRQHPCRVIASVWLTISSLVLPSAQLNVMHIALTNDEGWRLEIPGLDELTSVGSKRCFGERRV
jgi:hexosaminidase